MTPNPPSCPRDGQEMELEFEEGPERWWRCPWCLAQLREA